MKMKKNHYTVTSLAVRIGKSRPAAASLLRRMMKDGLADFVETITLGGPDSKNKAYVYELFINPERYMDGMRLPEPRIPKSTFYNNPFKLREAKDARYNP